MLKLYGFPVSNYVNMVQFALMEKGIPYDYVLTYPNQSAAFLAMSPCGKVPCLGTSEGFLNEASVILDYLENSGEGKPLLPTEPYARAKVRSLMKEIELYIELPARACFGEAFFGGTIPDAIKAKSKDELIAGFAALKRHAAFSPYVAGQEFSLADIVFFFSVDLAAGVAERMFGLDLLADIPEAKTLRNLISENPNIQKIAEAREAAWPAFIAYIKAQSAGK